jgi:thymidylate kinase
MKTVLITLSGTHGSGKSTNAAKCYYLLNRTGLKFSYLRHQDLLDPFGFVLRRAKRLLGFMKMSDLEKLRPVRILWSIYFLFIYYPFLAGGITLRRLLGYNVVCDRYLYDLLVGFWDNGMSAPIERMLILIIPHPDLSFVLEADEGRILSDRPEHTADYILLEQRMYRRIAEQFRLERISTNDPPDEVWKRILNEISAAMTHDRTGPTQDAR